MVLHRPVETARVFGNFDLETSQLSDDPDFSGKFIAGPATTIAPGIVTKLIRAITDHERLVL
jgi:hypothetical protein